MNQESEEFKATETKAEQGDAESQFSLGKMYYKGQGVPQDDVEALEWIRRAAQQGHAEAQSTLRQLAEQGHASAQYNLGWMYYTGVGVPENDIEAYAWFLLAKAKGNEYASGVIPDLEKRLTAGQREKGQARAAELQRLIGAK